MIVPHEQQIGRHLHKDLSLDEKTMPHVYVIVSRSSTGSLLGPHCSSSLLIGGEG